MPRLKDFYTKEIIPAMKSEFGYKNALEVPKLSKVVINMGLSDAKENIKVIDIAVKQLSSITGQRPVVTRAKKSISNFKIREGMPIGCKVTLRGDIMYEFMDRLINVALPRIRDFRGIPRNSFDGRGNYTLGLKDQTIFSEIDYEKIDKLRGMDITVVTTAKNNEQAEKLLVLFGMPFREK
ncbi:MAG: 50S ribosomal protein L5 [bacterium]|nr:50S ribosomal protein L5 [bacterium]MDD5354756.1 50S ribosomal protein L5 [bacterium]MDD5756127.1 50S ribosomal protein L5 [bacterium]